VVSLRGRRVGFTLLEVLLAITIIGVATSIGISLYRNGLRLSEQGANHKLAAHLAREALLKIQTMPEAFTWPDAHDAPAPLTTGEGESWRAFDPLAASPTESRARTREDGRLAAFSWQALARTRPDMPGTREITVVVRWEDGGRDYAHALTALTPEPGAGGDA
jgi:prepilin-type N-terminal cleavage/methylation domain-containing protein